MAPERSSQMKYQARLAKACSEAAPRVGDRKGGAAPRQNGAAESKGTRRPRAASDGPSPRRPVGRRLLENAVIRAPDAILLHLWDAAPLETQVRHSGTGWRLEPTSLARRNTRFKNEHLSPSISSPF